MTQRRIGVAVTGLRDSGEVLQRIERVEAMGIPTVWLTTSGAGNDGLTLLAAAAARTQRVLMGTAITPTWPRHPVAVAQQVQVIAGLAPGRFRLGVGPSHQAGMETTFGVDFRAPLGHLREYLTILKALLHEGEVEFAGRYYQAKARTSNPVDVPVMASALRRRSFELCGAMADGAITWVCPGRYLEEVALPALREGAEGAGRPVPPLIAHVPICVHDRADEVYAAVQEQMGYYPATPFYHQMFVDAGFPEAAELKAWSNRMIDAVALWGDESQVKERLHHLFEIGVSEVIVSPVMAGDDRAASLEKALRVVADAAG